jgi:hypothetical protein
MHSRINTGAGTNQDREEQHCGFFSDILLPRAERMKDGKTDTGKEEHTQQYNTQDTSAITIVRHRG